jgi:hypothetical protein
MPAAVANVAMAAAMQGVVALALALAMGFAADPEMAAAVGGVIVSRAVLRVFHGV